MIDDRPTHLIAAPGDTHTICGKRDQPGPTTPYVWIDAASRHIQGYGMRVCADCVAALGAEAGAELVAAVAQPAGQMEMLL